MRRAREREEAGRLDLEILDPATGEALAADAAPTDRSRTPNTARAARLRALALVLAVLSVAAAGGAGYRAAGVSSLARIDRAWAEAMALDRARQAADDEVRAAVERTGGETGRGRDDTYRAALAAIGEETTARLLAIEESLAERRILDGGVADVRTAMVDALRFRRRQLGADRGLLGSTPLERADRALRVQLDRFGLRPAVVPPRELRAHADALESVRRFAPVDTDTLLVALRARRLLHIDVDANRVDDRTLPRAPQQILAADDLILVADGEQVTAYPRRPDRPALWAVAGARAVPGRPDGLRAVWVTTPAGVRGVGPDGAAGPVVALPPGAELLADTDAGLLVRDGGDLRFHDPVSGAAGPVLAPSGRFAGAGADFVAVQAEGRPALTIHRLKDGSPFTLDLPRTDAGPVVKSPTTNEYAFAAGPLAGNIASMLRLELEGDVWDLVGVGGPRATVAPASLSWAPSGRDLFWLTPDGRVGMASDRVGPGLVRAPVEGLEQLVALTPPG